MACGFLAANLKCKHIRNNQLSGMLLSFTVCVCLGDHLFGVACLAINQSAEGSCATTQCKLNKHAI